MVFSSLPWVRRQVAPIAVDFGHRVVRMLQLARQRSHLTLLRYAQRELPPSIDDAVQLDRLQAAAVADMLASEGFLGRETITTLGWDDVTIRSIRVPSTPRTQLREMVVAESIAQMSLDPQATEVRYLPAGEVRQGSKMAQEVIVLAASRAAIDAHVRKLQAMGLTPASIDAPPCAVFRCFERFLRRDEDHSAANVFVDIGYAATRILASRGNELVFVKSVPIGSRRFDELMGMQMDLCVSDAAKLRIRLHRYQASLITGCSRQAEEMDVVSDNMSRAMLDAIRPAIDHLGKEILQSLRYCTATFRGPQAQSVTVIGGEAFNTDMLQLMSDQVNVPFQIGKPLRNIALEPALESSNRRTGQPEWATVLGLGLKTVQPSPVRS